MSTVERDNARREYERGWREGADAQAQQDAKALLDCRDFLMKRDEMNGVLHLEQPRMSPLTILVDRTVGLPLPEPPKEEE